MFSREDKDIYIVDNEPLISRGIQTTRNVIFSSIVRCEPMDIHTSQSANVRLTGISSIHHSQVSQSSIHSKKHTQHETLTAKFKIQETGEGLYLQRETETTKRRSRYPNTFLRFTD